MKTLASVVLLTLASLSYAVAKTVDVGPSVAAAGGEIKNLTIVVKRLSDNQVWIANPDRAQLRYSPASTSKIPHSLIALENGLASLETLFKWDGVPRSNREWNRDQTIESAFQESVVWVFQEIARTAGQHMMSEGLQSFGFGNSSVGRVEQLTTYWLDDTLKISALEQVAFLSNLAQERLPLSAATYAAAKEIMISDTGGNWTMRSKTGWRYSKTDMDIGWFVGWLECRSQTYVFALNMDMPDTRFLSKRKTIAYHVLRDIGAFECG